MLLTIQYPLADARALIRNTGMLDVPSWDNPEHEFVRNFGAIRIRKKGGLEGWIGENEICEASRIPSFKKDISIRLQGSTKKTHLKCQFRRLYYDGWAVGKFEVGIRLRNHLETHLKFIDAKELIDHILSLRVGLNGEDPGETGKHELIAIGREIARLYRIATTQHQFKKAESWWVQAGNPILFLEYKTDHIKFPFFINPVLSKDEYELSWCLVPHKGINYRAWLLKVNPQYQRADGYDVPRALRISLLRLNAEHESLRLILKLIKNGQIDDLGDNFQNYLNRSTAKIMRLEAGASKNSNSLVVDTARQAINKITPGEQEKIEDKISQIRLNIRRKQREYAEKDIKAAEQPPIDLLQLANQLGILLQALEKLAPSEKISREQITSSQQSISDAKKEALNKDGKRMLEHLSKAGAWILEVGMQIGAPILTDALRVALGLR